MFRLGVVSFLNSRPLIEGLSATGRVRVCFDLPAQLPQRLVDGTLDAALAPIIDVIRSAGRLRIISDACIGCDGETMTVRVFSRQPPHQVRRLRVDVASHTSVVLARILWRELFDRDLELIPFDPRTDEGEAPEAMLLIGDKVVDPTRGNHFGFEVDLGAAWRHHTGLPFVFAVWAAQVRPETAPSDELAALLSAARDRGTRRADQIVDEFAPALGWPRELAQRYLTRCLLYRLTDRLRAGAERFATLAAAHGLAPEGAAIEWPAPARAAGPDVPGQRSSGGALLSPSPPSGRR